MTISRVVAALGLWLVLAPTAVQGQATPVPPSADAICGPLGNGTPVSTPSVEAAAPSPGELDFDLLFLEAVVPLLRAGSEIAAVAAERSEHPELAGFAKNGFDSRQLALGSLEGWRGEWYPDVPTLSYQHVLEGMTAELADSPGVGGVAGIEEMDPTHLASDTRKICTAGDDVDLVFIDLLVAQNASATILYREAINRTTHREIKAVAQALLDGQQFEIDQAIAWREAWFPGVPYPDHHAV